ncbi:hypothetical protein LMG33818_002200 [Halomonadaceae bacterium LMG 33818]
MLPLVGENWSIGAGKDVDLVLFDSGFAASQLFIYWANQWCYEMQGSATLLDGAKNSLPGEGVIETGVPLCAGGVWLCIMSADAAWPEEGAMTHLTSAKSKSGPIKQGLLPWMEGRLSSGRGVSKPAFLSRMNERTLWVTIVASLFVIAILGILLWSFFTRGQSDFSNNAYENAASPVSKLTLSPENAAQHLEYMLAERDIDQSVKVNRKGNDIQLTGSVDGEQQGILSRMLTTFSMQYHTPAHIENRTTPISTRLPFGIRQIVGGSDPQVVLDTGHRMYQGDTYKGVKLVSVTASTVNFQSGEQQYEVHW